ncbi:SPOR domain-containing protein [Leucothrix sargassi]|nr:SPOR domain-containing protein [Leucothrix sargassi]
MPPLMFLSLVSLILLVSTTTSASTHVISLNTLHHSPHPVSLSSQSSQHVVQLFSTVNATKAEGMKNTLLNQGFPAFVNTHTAKNKPFYQVQIGPFTSKVSAKQARQTIINHYPQFQFLKLAILKSTH